MYFSDSWSFLVELETYPGEKPLASIGIVPVDLSAEEDRGDVEPYRDVATGVLHCTLGVTGDRVGNETRKITRVWEYKEDEPFNDKFSMFKPVSLVHFVRRLLDANRAFDGFTKEETTKLKEAYGV